MEDYDKSKDQLIAELQQLRQKVKIIENKATLLRHNNFISNTKDHISFIDSNYLYFDVNQTYLKTHKLKREDVVGRFVEDIFGKEIFTSYIKKNIDKCLKGEVIKYQKWFNFPKNVKRYMDVAFYPFYDKDNLALGIMVSSHDITELKIKEELLADREQKYQALIENTPGMVYMGIPDWTNEIVGGVEEICGYSDKELRTGQLKWKDIIHPDDKERIELETEKLFKKAQSKVYVYRIITKKGQIKWVEDRMTSFFYEQEGNYRIDGIVLDITERKKTEEVLKKSEERFRNLFTRIPIGLYRSSLDGRIIEANPAMVKMLGYPNREALLDTNVSDIFVDFKIRQQKMDSFDQGTTISNNTFQLYCYDRKIITVQDMASCVKNTKGKILYFEGSLEEITDRKKDEEILKESEQKLRELNATKDKFFSIIAHDLKSPFNTMLGFSNLLVDKFDQYNALEQKKFIDILNQDIQNTYELLENLLLWSRSQRGALDFYLEKENLYLLAVESFNLLNQSAVNKSIKIINRVPENIYVYTDKDMLATVIRNLISNAIKFTPQGGEIVLHACIKSDENKKTHVEISVNDNGIGIEKEKLDHLFKISENISTKGTEGEAGTGLGLILCKEFVEKHGDRIWVESEVGKGSKFIFWLPETS